MPSAGRCSLMENNYQPDYYYSFYCGQCEWSGVIEFFKRNTYYVVKQEFSELSADTP